VLQRVKGESFPNEKGGSIEILDDERIFLHYSVWANAKFHNQQGITC